METGELEPTLQENEPSPSGNPNNRLFLILAGVLAGILLVTIAGMLVYGLYILPQQRYAEATQIALIGAEKTQAAIAAEQTILAMSWTRTPTNTPIPDTVTPSPTATVTPVVADDETQTPTIGPQTATAGADLTQEAQDQSPTPVPLTPTFTEEPPTPTAPSPTSTPTATEEPFTPTSTPLVPSPSVTPQPSTPTATATPSALPDTGFSEAGAIPLIALLCLGLVVVIFFARKLRATV